MATSKTRAADLRTRAAAALDATHEIGERGPRTFNARRRIAEALDLGGAVTLLDVTWLEWVVQQPSEGVK